MMPPRLKRLQNHDLSGKTGRGEHLLCYDDGTIKIRLRNVKNGEPLKYSGLVSTLCHELAHLRHFHHGPDFQALNMQLLTFARREGIYRPAPRRRETPPTTQIGRPVGSEASEIAPRAGAPLQLELFT